MSKNSGRYLTKFTARGIRRAAGDFMPVNPKASLAQHPTGTRYAKSLITLVMKLKAVKELEKAAELYDAFES